ncbi:hypothetical protein BGZ46_008654 [Entomortierella lignicola]|nr:hypothetical protein BGZ46_008654 [Entomortierella lignicola]
MLNGDVAANYGSPVGGSLQLGEEIEDRQRSRQWDNYEISITSRRGMLYNNGSPHNSSVQQHQILYQRLRCLHSESSNLAAQGTTIFKPTADAGFVTPTTEPVATHHSVS